MIRNFGPTELIILLVIIILLFGVGRIGKVAKELGGGIRAFREGLKGDEEQKPASDEKDKTQSS
jgi:sec-independent protein translocase protein TatA